MTELNVCIPKSLEKWKQKQRIKEEGSMLSEGKKCNQTKILESILTGTKPPKHNNRKEKVLSRKYWNNLDKKLKRDKLLSYFPKVFSRSSKLKENHFFSRRKGHLILAIYFRK